MPRYARPTTGSTYRPNSPSHSRAVPSSQRGTSTLTIEGALFRPHPYNVCLAQIYAQREEEQEEAEEEKIQDEGKV